MTLQSFQIDPVAGIPLTANEHVDAINAATNDITRAGSVDPSARPIEAGEIGTAQLAAAGVTVAKLASTAARDNLNALTSTERQFIRTLPDVGEFPVIFIQREADGDLDVTYDDVPIA